MESRAKLFGHPIHQMLVVLPLGMFAAAIACDIARIVTGAARFGDMAHFLMGGGVVTALLAAPFGWVDWMAIPPYTRAKSVGRRHALGNVLVIALFGASWLLRREAPGVPSWLAIALAVGGGLVVVVTAWHGGELVSRMGVGVAEGAHLNSPSSLSRRSAREGGPILSRSTSGAARHTPGRRN